MSLMRAALIDRYGSNDAVRLADVDIPTMGATVGRCLIWCTETCPAAEER